MAFNLARVCCCLRYIAAADLPSLLLYSFFSHTDARFPIFEVCTCTESEQYRYYTGYYQYSNIQICVHNTEKERSVQMRWQTVTV